MPVKAFQEKSITALEEAINAWEEEEGVTMYDVRYAVTPPLASNLGMLDAFSALVRYMPRLPDTTIHDAGDN